MLEDKLDQFDKKKDHFADGEEVLNSWKKELGGLEFEKSVLELPPVIKLADTLKGITASVNDKLVNNRAITELERQYLFAVKDVIGTLLPMLDIETNTKKINSLEGEIDASLKL